MIFTIFLITTAIALFTITFIKMLNKNSSNYIYLLIMEFIGIFISFIFLFLGKQNNIIENTIIFIFSVFIPSVIFILEKKFVDFDEIVDAMAMKLKKEYSKEELLSIVSKKPRSFIAHKKLAEYYEKNNEKEKALDEYYKLINLKPNEYNTYINIAQIQYELKNTNEAIATLQEALKEKPDFYDGSMLLGSILYENEKFKEALLVYNNILKYKPQEYNIYYCLGMTHTRLNDFQSAKEFYKKAATINSIKDISNLNLGQISLIFNEYDKAEEYFYESKNSEDDKISANAYFYLAKIKMIQNNNNQAIQYLNIATEVYPKIINKIEKEYIFMPILGKIIVQKDKKVKSKITKKEEELVEYLGKTYNVVETLTTNTHQHTINKDRE